MEVNPTDKPRISRGQHLAPKIIKQGGMYVYPKKFAQWERFVQKA